MNVTIEVNVKHRALQELSASTVLHFPLAAPLLTTFPSSTQVPVSLLCSTIIILTILNPPLPGDNYISKLLSASSYSFAPTLQFFLAIQPQQETQRHSSVELRCLQSQGATRKLNGSEATTNSNGLLKHFCVLKQHLLLWNCSRSQYFFSSWIQSKAKSFLIHEWCCERRQKFVPRKRKSSK